MAMYVYPQCHSTTPYSTCPPQVRFEGFDGTSSVRLVSFRPLLGVAKASYTSFLCCGRPNPHKMATRWKWPTGAS